jgi:iron-only hydrogenase group A
VDGLLVAALRRLGFDRVFDTSFSADLTIMEEASELVHRVSHGGVLPMFTSCSPGWIKYVEQFFPDMIPNLSSCKSPQQMLGAVIKNVYAERQGIDPHRIYSVSLMPCIAKKFEAARPEMGASPDVPDVDAVLTTREIARLIRKHGLDLARLEPEHADLPFGERSTAGKLFGGSGGVMEAALRTAQWLLTGKDPSRLTIRPVRGMEGVKELRVEVAGLDLGVAVVNGLGHARRLLEEIRAGRDDLHFVEVMTCPGGCIGGGGQPHGTDLEARQTRQKALYKIDQGGSLRLSHRNAQVRKLYDEVLGEPLGETSHRLLHTRYLERKVLK